ncbi:hypothetical protein C0J52_10237 [Blattella germanica]|nr:hypothetical protein C0J52_10237 [Blattella germanica]
MIYIYGFCDGNTENAVTKYQKQFPTHRTPSSRVSVHMFQSVRDNGSVPSVGVIYEYVVVDYDQKCTNNVAHKQVQGE